MDDGGPAFPSSFVSKGMDCNYEGMTLRDYACIKLKVPDTGKKWLDKIILKSLRNDFSGQIMPTVIADIKDASTYEGRANYAYLQADAMIKERSKT